MQPLPYFRQSIGLNTVEDPVQIPYSSETGVAGLQAAVNVTHRGNTGRIGLRDGQTPIHFANCHSGFPTKENLLYIEERTTDAAIFMMSRDETHLGVRSGLTKGKHVSWASAGEEVYYSNGVENGVILNRRSHPWPDYSAASFGYSERVFFPAPVADLLAIGHGRMWLAKGQYLYYSEPFNFGKYATGTSYIKRPSDIKMVLPVDAGVFVSDSHRITFYQGTDPKEMKPTTVAEYPVIDHAYSMDSIPGRDIGKDGAGDCYAVATPEGLCFLSSLGYLINDTKNTVIYPEDASSGSVLVKGYNIIHCLNRS